MKRVLIQLITVWLLSGPLYGAVTIVECEDQEGNRTFQSHCPPGSTEVTEKTFGTGIAKPEQPEITPVLYTAPDCSACDAVREFFSNQEIPIQEKNIDGNEELQNELRRMVGELRVPTIVVGKQFVKNYKRDLLVKLLEQSGFTLDKEKF